MDPTRVPFTLLGPVRPTSLKIEPKSSPIPVGLGRNDPVATLEMSKHPMAKSLVDHRIKTPDLKTRVTCRYGQMARTRRIPSPTWSNIGLAFSWYGGRQKESFGSILFTSGLNGWMLTSHNVNQGDPPLADDSIRLNGRPTYSTVQIA